MASGFSIEIELDLDRKKYVPLMQQSSIQDYVCQHSDFNKAVHSSKRSKNTVCKAKLSVKIKPISANTRAKDKYVKVGVINTYFSWLLLPPPLLLLLLQSALQPLVGLWPAQLSLTFSAGRFLQSAVASSTSKPPTWRTSD